MTTHAYWIGVVSKNHVDTAVAGGFAQVNHGKAGPLERMRAATALPSIRRAPTIRTARRCRRSPPSAACATGSVYQADAATDFRPFRVAIDYLPATPAPVRPLIDALTFIRSKTHWGAAFRFGLVRVPAEDFARIAAAMGRDFTTDFGS